jgi:hypothetical protein
VSMGVDSGRAMTELSDTAWLYGYIGGRQLCERLAQWALISLSDGQLIEDARKQSGSRCKSSRSP